MKKGSSGGGIGLLLFGGALLVAQLRPDLLHAWFGLTFPWPFLITTFGFLALAFSVLTRSRIAVLITASITAAAALQAYQNVQVLPVSLVYLWPLVPALAGLRLFHTSLDRERKKENRANGVCLLAISLLAVAIFYAMTAANLNMLLTWASLLILSGGYMLVYGQTGHL